MKAIFKILICAALVMGLWVPLSWAEALPVAIDDPVAIVEGAKPVEATLEIQNVEHTQKQVQPVVERSEYRAANTVRPTGELPFTGVETDEILMIGGLGLATLLSGTILMLATRKPSP